MTNVHDRLLQSATPLPLDVTEDAPGDAPPSANVLQNVPPDRVVPITRRPPVFSGENSLGGGINGAGGEGRYGILSQILSLIQQLLSSLGFTQFASASASSTGDPHLAFDGTAESGAHVGTKFDSTCGHGDLPDSGSFAGGYRVSTMTTVPDANGIAYNREASVTTGGGQTRVSLDNAGNASTVEGTQQMTLSDGQSLDMGGGAAVSRAQDGTVTVNGANAFGGTISTALRRNGSGVDATVEARNVTHAGDLLDPR